MANYCVKIAFKPLEKLAAKPVFFYSSIAVYRA